MKRNKYHARAVQMGPLKFASRAEAARYLVLADMQKRGEIVKLVIQPEYDLPAKIVYRADFSYDAFRDGTWTTVVEDVKGIETAVFRLKKRLFEWRYGMQLTVTRMRSSDVNNLLAAARVV